MEHIQIYESELRLMELIWDHAPVRSTVLAQMAGEILGWKKSTVFTVIKKLAGRGILLNENAIVTFGQQGTGDAFGKQKSYRQTISGIVPVIPHQFPFQGGIHRRRSPGAKIPY